MATVIALLLITLLFSFSAAAYLWPHRDSSSVRLVFVLITGIVGWSLGYALELVSPSIELKLFLASLQYPFIAMLPVAWIGLAMTIARNGRPPSPRVVLALAALPVAVLIAVWTNHWHQLVWPGYRLGQIGDLQVLLVDHGPIFWVFNIYSMVAIASGLMLMIWSAFRTGSIGPSHRLSLFVAAVLPGLGNLVYSQKLGPWPGLDLTPLAFSVSALALAYSVRGNGLMSIVLVARDLVMERLPEAVFVLNNRGLVVDVNESARMLSGDRWRARSRNSLAQLLPFLPDDWETQSASGLSCVVEPSDDNKRMFRVESMPLQSKAGSQNSGLVVVASDITEERRARQRLEDARIAAEQANIAKSRFLANMSHEIRTPMNGILGMAELLKFEELDGVAREYVDTILSSGATLLAILNDILDVAKAESGKLELHPEPVDLRQMIEEIGKLFYGQARDKGLIINRDIDSRVPGKLLADAVRLRQIIMNLVNNALKFTLQGSVSIKAAWGALESGDQPGLLLTIADTGIGIAEKDQAKIFASFEQVDSGDARRFGGTGLGLAIVGQLVDLMGGSISVSSQLGQGSAFTLHLPLEPAR